MTFEVSQDDYLRKVVADRAALLAALKYMISVRSIECTSHPAGDDSCAKCRADAVIAKAETP